MKWIKKFKTYKESLYIDLSINQVNLKESLNIWDDVLLNSISAEEVDIFDTIKLPEEFKNKQDIDILSNSIEFLTSISSLGLKKSQVQSTEDFETFLNKPCKFMFVYDINSNELENPEYILFQNWNDTMQKWEEVKLFRVKDDVKKFYDKLTSRTIELIDGDKNYIYATSNGNDWNLENIDNNNDTYKKFLTKEELQKLLDDNKIKLNII